MIEPAGWAQGPPVPGVSKRVKPRLIAGCLLVLCGGLAFAQSFLGEHLVLLLGITLVAGLLTARGMYSFAPVLVLLPVTGFLRRVTSGPSAYQYNDPLALLPIALLVPIVLVGLPRVKLRACLPVTLLLAWTILGQGVAVAMGAQLQTVAYGSFSQLIPILVALVVATGAVPIDQRQFRALAPGVLISVSIYGLVQYVSPARWDLAWLSTQQDRSTSGSVGVAVARGFRIFGTMESPGVFAMGLAVGVALLAVPMFISVRQWSLWRLGGVVALMSALALTQVRTALFALPIALGVVVVADKRVRRRVLIPILVAFSLAALVLPVLLIPTTGSSSRYDVTNLSEDQSFQARAALLPRFEDAVVHDPLGMGLGSSGIASRLSAAGPNLNAIENVDNGFLARIIETGVPGLLLFLAVTISALWRVVRRLRFGRARSTDAAAMAVVMLFVLAEFSGPLIASSVGIYFWVSIALILAPSSVLGEDLFTQLASEYRV